MQPWCNNEVEISVQIGNYLDFIEKKLNTLDNSIRDSKYPSQPHCAPGIGIDEFNSQFLSGDIWVNDKINQSISKFSPLLSKDLVKPNSFVSILSTIITGAIATVIAGKVKKNNDSRRGFSQSIKRKILKKQKNKCINCKKFLIVFDFDHKNGNRADNSESNCQALCPNCHAIKTRQNYYTR